ncbi:hypothetical protein SAMN05421831_10938 [Allopseudospirillum japonicum]|uniref:Lipoprotein n=1 Tax=Allopseudospirillum japonicum TaxID=64971 RepID=A0A1H6T9F1_9GAMM|nr:hypothetical protein [Allopseudospirillum japonicum]SEI74764.1 hypothetical protein SAMN05421831_10938 [Allopseudospirillum japonicum]
MPAVMRKTLAVVALSSLLGACAGQQSAPQQAQAPQLNNDDLYEVHTESRVYVFDDYHLYQEYLTTGHTPYVMTRIGEGPEGKTLVFGLADADKKKRSGIASVDMYAGKLVGAENFYGEMRAEGRIYVFSRLEDMQEVRTTGEAPYRYTAIGAGPQGETLVYVLHGANKKQRPDDLIKAFKARHQQAH